MSDNDSLLNYKFAQVIQVKEVSLNNINSSIPCCLCLPDLPQPNLNRILEPSQPRNIREPTLNVPESVMFSRISDDIM